MYIYVKWNGDFNLIKGKDISLTGNPLNNKSPLNILTNEYILPIHRRWDELSVGDIISYLNTNPLICYADLYGTHHLIANLNFGIDVITQALCDVYVTDSQHIEVKIKNVLTNVVLEIRGDNINSVLSN